MINVAINGFGRIGKSFLRTVLKDEHAQSFINVCVINVANGDPEAAALALKYDTLMGTLNETVTYKDGYLHLGAKKIKVVSFLDPKDAPWKDNKIDWVVEASGHFTKGSLAKKHLDAGAKGVVITAPAEGEDITIIKGINDHLFDPVKHFIVSLGSCTTNALCVMLEVIDKEFGIKSGAMTTVHAYTNTQALLDVDATAKDMRKGRAAALNIVPTTTGAMQTIYKVMPQLKDTIMGMSLRVPVAKVSIIDLVVNLNKAATTQQINKAYKDASVGKLGSVLGYSTEPLVSSDYSGNDKSVIIDSLMTNAYGDVCKVFGWYDNEWGYSERIKDFLLNLHKK